MTKPEDPMREIDLLLLEEAMMRSKLDTTAGARKMQIASFVVYALVVACWSSALLNGNRATVGAAPNSSQADARLAAFPGDAGRPTR